VREGPDRERSLDALRARLSEIDRALILALCARESVQREILALKLSRSVPLFDREREGLVRRRARTWAIEAGGDPELAALVVAAALESGKRRFLRGLLSGLDDLHPNLAERSGTVTAASAARAAEGTSES